MAQTIDLTHQVFGQWTVLSLAGKTESGLTLWTCRCDCGTKKDVLGSELRRGRARKCKTCVGKAKIVDLAGRTFGRWDVISWVDYAPDGVSRWLSRCHCGSEHVVRASELLRGGSTQCRRCAYDDLRISDTEVGYDTMHARLTNEIGPAKDHLCVSCQSPAAAWAYQHTAGRNERTESRLAQNGKASLMTFSTDPDDYAPMCHSCHVRLDQQQAKVRQSRETAREEVTV